jgi:hypothetical protein
MRQHSNLAKDTAEKVAKGAVEALDPVGTRED